MKINQQYIKNTIKVLLGLVVFYCMYQTLVWYTTDHPQLCDTIDKSTASGYLSDGKYPSYKYVAKVTKPDGSVWYEEVNKVYLEAGQRCYTPAGPIVVLVGLIFWIMFVIIFVITFFVWLFYDDTSNDE